MKVRIDGWAWLRKSDFTDNQLRLLRAKLTVVPRKVGDHPGDPPSPIRLYREETDYIGVARQYYLANRKPHHEVEFDVTEGRKDLWGGPLSFAGSLREEQARALREVSNQFRGGIYGGILRASPGWGKCLGLGTPVLKFDGSIVPVEAVKEGDLLMGPDSKPRRVLSTTRGTGPLYRIVPTVGDSWVCNDAHILTLVHSVTNEVQDIPLQDYLRLPAWKKRHLKQFSPEDGVEFQSGPLPLDPYFVGVWFGDGSKRIFGATPRVAITTKDAEIEQLCRDTAAVFGLHVRVDLPKHLKRPCPTYLLAGNQEQRNPLLDLLREVVGDAQRLPKPYLCASREDRLKFLAGLLDTDGFHNNGCYEIIQKRKAWAEDICFLARSLGIRATMREKYVKFAHREGGETYWRVKLAGDFSSVPLRIERKLPRKRLQKKTATRTGFAVESLGVGEYAGFTLEGDGRFLLGDFVVTHNTVWSAALTAEMQVPTLVVVHKEFLMNQWRERIEQFLPGARVGYVQEDTCDFKGKHIVLAMVHSLVGRDYEAAFYGWPGLVITDESVPAHSRVLTEHGYRTVEALVASETPVRVVAYDREHRRFVLRPVTCRWVHRPRNPMLRIRHEYGSFECTAEHLVITPTGDVRARDLVSGVDCVVHYCDDRPRQTVQSATGADSRFDDGGWLHQSSSPFGRGAIPSTALPRAESLGAGEIRSIARVVSHDTEGKAQQRLGEVYLCGQHFEPFGSRRTPQKDVPRRNQAGELGTSQRVLVASDDGVVGDGRRECWGGTDAATSHGELSAKRSEAPRSLVYEEGLQSLGGEVPLVQGVELLDYGVEADCRVRATPRHSRIAVQGGSVLRPSQADFVHPVRAGDSFFIRQVRQPNLLWFPSLSESRPSGSFWALSSQASRDLREVQELPMRGVFETDDSQPRSCLHQEADLLLSVRQSEGDLESPEALLRDAEGNLAGYPVASRVLSVTEVETPDLVYDLSVGEHHNFVVEGVVLHNCHRIGAATWSQVPPKFKAKWRLGITATPRRKDGSDNVFYYHIGDILFAASEQRMKPKVRRVWTEFNLVKTPTLNPALIPKSLLLRFMCANKARNKLIAKQLVLALNAGRKVLVLSERLAHLTAMEMELREQWKDETDPLPTIGYYVGGMTEEALDVAAQKQVIFATRQFAEEGLDIPALDTLFLTTPMSDVEQAVGRILRPFEGKKEPVVVDFRDDRLTYCVKLGESRDRYYKKVS